MTFNKVIHETNRLRIMSVLGTLKSDEEIDFNYLKKNLDLSDGNLSVHLSVLEKNKYIKIKKIFVNKKPRTLYRITKRGREAFFLHLSYLEELIRSSKAFNVNKKT